MLYSGEEIKRLIPQRAPIMQVDEVLSAEENTAVTGLSLSSRNCFVLPDGHFAENGLVEHIAQSASAFAGHRAIVAGQENPPVGFIGEVKRCRFYRRPMVGAKLRTTISMGAEVNGITIVGGETCEVLPSGECEKIAETQLKIFIEDESKSQEAKAQEPQIAEENMNGNDFFNILSTTPLNENLEGSVHVRLCPDFRLYRGHFPGRPVSPGVCNIGMIKGVVEHLTGKTLVYSEIRQCRLTAVASPIISPELDVNVTLKDMENGYQIVATIASDTQVYMELKGSAVEL